MTDATWLFWFQAASALGSLATVGAFLFLWRRDKTKEDQLVKLGGIVDSQNEIAGKMQEQLNALLYQSILMTESNRIFQQEYELQTKVFEFQKGVTESTQEIERKKIEIEKQKRINDIKPFIEFRTATSGPDTFELRLYNRGETANNVAVESNPELYLSTGKNQLIQKAQDVVISGKGKVNPQWRNIQTSFNILYTDADDNRYTQRIKVQAGHFTIDPPVPF